MAIFENRPSLMRILLPTTCLIASSERVARCKLRKALSVCHPIFIRDTVISLVPPHLTVITYFGGHHTTVPSK
ncbi:hypothetical protein ACE6H2_001540 [Prunus campanulata]